MNRIFCANCICLVEDDAKNWVCDEADEIIENIEVCVEVEKIMEKEFDVVGFIMDWENAVISEEEVIKGFQQLINSGVVWTLNGRYGKTANYLINAGLCKRGEK